MGLRQRLKVFTFFSPNVVSLSPMHKLLTAALMKVRRTQKKTNNSHRYEGIMFVVGTHAQICVCVSLYVCRITARCVNNCSHGNYFPFRAKDEEGASRKKRKGWGDELLNLVVWTEMYFAWSICCGGWKLKDKIKHLLTQGLRLILNMTGGHKSAPVTTFVVIVCSYW